MRVVRIPHYSRNSCLIDAVPTMYTEYKSALLNEYFLMLQLFICHVEREVIHSCGKLIWK